MHNLNATDLRYIKLALELYKRTQETNALVAKTLDNDESEADGYQFCALMASVTLEKFKG